jgi:hypothetical protein
MDSTAPPLGWALAALAGLALAACDSTEPAPPPDSPAPIAAVPNSDRQVTLSWGLTRADADQVHIERADASGAFAPLTTLPGTSRTFVDAGLAPGTPYQYRIQACNASGCSAFAGPVAVSTFATLAITTTSLSGAVVGDSVRFAIQSTGGSSPVTFSLAAGALPAGVTLSSAGVLSGTPTSTGSFPITVRAASADGQVANVALIVLVRARLAIVTNVLPNAVRGQPYSTGLTASGADSVYTWFVEAGSLPGGLSLSNRGIISGTPTAEQVGRFTARVRSGDGQTAVRDFSITVVAPVTAPALSIQTAQLPPALSNQIYQPQIFTSGGDGSAVSWSLAGGTLPPGITLTTGGVFTGRSAAVGSYTITVRATNASSQSDQRTFTFAVVADDVTRYNITRIDVSTVPANIAPHLTAAIARWENVLRGDLSRDDIPRGFFQPGSNNLCSFASVANGTWLDDLLLLVNIAPIDGVGKILGQATPCAIRFSILTEVGILQLDSDDLSRYVGTQTLTDIIFHEIGHILGVGTLWSGFGCPPTDGFTACWDFLTGAGTTDPRFTGPLAVQEWQALGGTGSVPVENEGGEGTKDSHWRETTFKSEIMTGFVSPVGTPNPLSRVTIASMADLGYSVNMGAADAFTLSAGAALRIGVGDEPWEEVGDAPILMKMPNGSKRTIVR